MAGIDLSGVARWIEDNLMLDVVRITRPAAGEPVFNPVTGGYDVPDPEVVYEGMGAVQARPTDPAYIGGINATMPWVNETSSKYSLLTPLDAPTPFNDYLVSVVEVHEGGDRSLLGREWQCRDTGRAGTTSAVRITPVDQIRNSGRDGDGA